TSATRRPRSSSSVGAWRRHASSRRWSRSTAMSAAPRALSRSTSSSRAAASLSSATRPPSISTTPSASASHQARQPATLLALQHAQAVAAPAHRLDRPRPQLRPQLRHVLVDGPLGPEEPLAPHAVEQLGAREQPARVPEQEGEQLELAPREHELGAV